MNFLTNLVSGLSLGSIYALIALGYTMVYGIAGMLNFAHGDVIMVGAFTAIVYISNLGISPLLALPLTALTCAALGMTVERIAYKPLRSAPPLSVLITAIGVSYFLQNRALLIFGANRKTFPKFASMSPLEIGSLTIKGESVVTMLTAVIIMACLTLFISKSRMGKAMRAASEDKDACRLMGINVNLVITVTFAIGSALAAVAGIFYGLTYTFISPYTGSMPGIKAFVAAVFGGIGSIPGAMLGGVLLGVIETMSKAYVSTELSDAVVFGVLILVLLIKPSGLLGKTVREKV